MHRFVFVVLCLRALACALICVSAATLAATTGARAQDKEIDKLKTQERKVFTDAEITRGFFLTAFGSEMQIYGNSQRIRKYAVPIRVFVDVKPKTIVKPERRHQVAAVVADIKAHVKDLDIAMAARVEDANVIVHVLKERDFPRAIDTYFGAPNRRRILKSLEPQCLSGFRKDSKFRIEHSDVLLIDDVSTFIFYDCLYEELLQSLGPVNDTDKVSWTMFNDDVQKGFFDVYDQYILNILYHPGIKPGMTAKEARKVLPRILPSVREWVAHANDGKTGPPQASPRETHKERRAHPPS